MFTYDESKVLWDFPLGKGASGAVYPYGKNIEEAEWVIKNASVQDHNKFLKIMHEIVLGFSLEHPGVVPIRGYDIKPKHPNGWNIFIKLPRMKGDLRGILNDHVKKKVQIPERKIVRYLYTLASGLEYLHNKQIVHRDICPENILIDKTGEVKLSDIGRAYFIPEEETLKNVKEEPTRLDYAAPELFNHGSKVNKKDLYKADVWSLGAVLVELCIFEKTLGNLKESEINKKLLKIKGKYGDDLADVLGFMLRVKASERKTIGEVRRILEEKFSGVIKGVKTQEEKKEKISEERKIDEQMDKICAQEVNKIFCSDSDEKQKNDKRGDNVLHLQANEGNTINDDVLTSPLSELATKETEKGRDLEQLIANFQNCAKVTDEVIRDLAFEISKRQKITDLDLNFSGCSNLTDSGIQELAAIMRDNLCDLRYLTLNFSCCDQITDRAINYLIAKVQENLKKLKVLYLNFAEKS